jgi:DNA topoisomerase I
MKNLVIVESPTKAKIISKFLSKDYKLESSFGHIRDLPAKELGVDVDHDFIPTYAVPSKSRKRVTELKKLAKAAENIYYATDEDREGEAISWHLAQIFKTPIEKTKRITFHEITEEAIKESLKNPRTIDMDMVDAQQARRVLDRLVGYKLSPLLWSKVARGLSAGRVQSVAVRLIVEKEREIQAFKIDEYWEVFGDFKSKKDAFTAQLKKVDGKSLTKLAIKSEKDAKELKTSLEKAKYHIESVKSRKTKKNPLPPFTTSTLQQAANGRLGYSAKQTMMLAQRLYEGTELKGESTGLITYMRTDSLNLSKKFIAESADYIKKEIGDNYAETRYFKTKSKGAQEAHEAIRPTSAMRTPESVKSQLDPRQYKLYELIWQRAVASQMAPAQLEATSIDIEDEKNKYTFRVNGQVIKFDGYLKVYDTNTKEEILPELIEQEKVDCTKVNPEQKFTKPPARYSDATLVKIMESKGIGRPSTYAPTIATVIARNYVERLEDKRLKPTDIAMVVTDLLVEHFDQVVDYNFTAEMEDNLDKIADGKINWQKSIADFYKPFIKNIEVKNKELDKKAITEESTDEKCEKCKSEMIIKVGRYGKFLACSNYPECKNTKKINSKGEIEEKKEPELLEEKCPECDAHLVLRNGRFGEFKGCSAYPKCKYIKKEAQDDLNLECPKCKKGKIVTKRSRRGVFYACDQYPDCECAFWAKPSDKKCKDCGYPMVLDKNGELKCGNKECK